MTKSKIPNTRLGSKNNAHHVLQSLASIMLAGLYPGKKAISLAMLIANEKMTADEAVEIIKSQYRH